MVNMFKYHTETSLIYKALSGDMVLLNRVNISSFCVLSIKCTRFLYEKSGSLHGIYTY
jgi:hypothetical protein